MMALVSILMLGTGGAVVATGESSPSPMEGQVPSPASATHAVGSDPVAIEDIGPLIPDVALTSERFRPRVSFILRRFENSLHGEETDWCLGPSTSERMIRLQWLYACEDAFWLIRPYAVDCGTADEHPDATELASAILAKLGGKQVRDIGDISAAPGLDLAAHTGRTLLITTTEASQHVVDPDPCRLLPEPGSGDPTLTIRDDEDSLLMLMDVAGELVVLRAPADYEGHGLANAYLSTFQDFRFIE
jgi:hypothetical protein